MLRLAPVALVFLAVACGRNGDGDSPDGSTAEQFIAFATDFQNYKTWKSYAYDEDGGTELGPVLHLGHPFSLRSAGRDGSCVGAPAAFECCATGDRAAPRAAPV